MLHSIFDIATRLFPQDLEDTVDKSGSTHVSDVDWESVHIETTTWRLVGLEKLFSNKFYEELKNSHQPQLELEWSQIPDDVSSMYKLD